MSDYCLKDLILAYVKQKTFSFCIIYKQNKSVYICMGFYYDCNAQIWGIMGPIMGIKSNKLGIILMILTQSSALSHAHLSCQQLSLASALPASALWPPRPRGD